LQEGSWAKQPETVGKKDEREGWEWLDPGNGGYCSRHSGISED
jgi:hypothetical protein